MISAGGALVGAGLMAGVVLVSSLHGAPQPLPGPARALPAASSDAYLCSSTCANRPMEHDPTVEMAHHFGPPLGAIGPTSPMPAIVIGPLPVPAQPKAAAQKAPKGQKQASGSKGAKSSSGKAGKAPKAAKAPKQPKAPKATPTPVAVPATPTTPTTVGQ